MKKMLENNVPYQILFLAYSDTCLMLSRMINFNSFPNITLSTQFIKPNYVVRKIVYSRRSVKTIVMADEKGREPGSTRTDPPSLFSLVPI